MQLRLSGSMMPAGATSKAILTRYGAAVRAGPGRCAQSVKATSWHPLAMEYGRDIDFRVGVQLLVVAAVGFASEGELARLVLRA
jgi:hypothetical protein